MERVAVGQVWGNSKGVEWVVTCLVGDCGVGVQRIGRFRRDGDRYIWNIKSLNAVADMRLLRQPNARFWIWWNQSWVKLTLKPGQEVTLLSGGPTDEGYSHSAETYVHEGDRVACSVANESRDCDGPGSYYWSGACLLSNLAARPMWEVHACPENNGIRAPEWERLDSCRRDEFAEAMGY
jgi:hypothetical protein